MAPRKKNPWTSTSEVLLWILFVVLVFPAAFAGYAVGHYTSLGKPQATVTVTSPSMPGTVTSPTTTAMTTTSSSPGGQVAAGKTLFDANGCGSCHTFAPDGSTGLVGPNLDTKPPADATADHMALAAFIKDSIVNPQAYIAKGYTKPSAMPSNFGTSLSSTQIDDLVAFVLSGIKH